MKYLLLLLGPGSIAVFGLSLFFQLFSEISAVWPMIISALVFFLAFLPMFAVISFRENDRKSKTRVTDEKR